MASYTAYHLTFNTGLHLGRYTGPAQTGQLGLQKTEVYIPADTLFSALCQTWATFYGSTDLETFLDRYTAGETQLPFRLTSAFPFAGDVRFFPKPLIQPNIKMEDHKKFKKVQFVSHNVFKAILDGETPELEGFLINGGKMWVDAAEKEQLETLLTPPEKDKNEKENGAENDLTVWKADSRPRVTLDRESHESQIWHVETLTFNKCCGLWFAVEFDDTNDTEKIEDKIDTLLSVLGDAGIGGERNAGYGLFEFKKRSVKIETAAKSSRFVTLSPICPKHKNELQTLVSKDASYSLNPYGGWGNSTGTPFARKKVMMFDEGSVLTKAAGQIGRLVQDLKPDGDAACTHSVYRYGYAWPVGIKGESS